jgi:aspartate carbamoyltransferase catalytic subunit
MDLGSKDLLGIKEMSKEKILEIIYKAQSMKKVLIKGDRTSLPLKGKTVITLFYENSTRTRLSFELAAKYLGGTTSNISASGSSVAKGETLIDTEKPLNEWGSI